MKTTKALLTAENNDLRTRIANLETVQQETQARLLESQAATRKLTQENGSLKADREDLKARIYQLVGAAEAYKDSLNLVSQNSQKARPTEEIFEFPLRGLQAHLAGM